MDYWIIGLLDRGMELMLLQQFTNPFFGWVYAALAHTSKMAGLMT